MKIWEKRESGIGSAISLAVTMPTRTRMARKFGKHRGANNNHFDLTTMHRLVNSAMLQSPLQTHVERLKACTRCPKMVGPPVSGGPVHSQILLLGQAPGRHEPVLGRPFAWTAGRTLFSWFREHCGISEEQVRSAIYMAAVCRCFPGRIVAGTDRVPDQAEVKNCEPWLRAEFDLLSPKLVVPIGKLAISKFLTPAANLTEVIGHKFPIVWHAHSFDIIPLPHPSGASPWPRIEPGKTLLRQALALILSHQAFQNTYCRPE